MHGQPVFRDMGLYDDEAYPNSERMARKGLYIPSGLALIDEQQNVVIDAVLIEKNNINIEGFCKDCNYFRG